MTKLNFWRSIGVVLVSLLSGAQAQAAFISGSIGVTDIGTPSTFSFTLSSPVSPNLTGMLTWSAVVSGTLTDSPQGDGISATPFGGSIFEFIIGSTTVGTDTLGTITASPFSGNYGGSFDCGLAGCNSISSAVHFTGSGGGDGYGLSFQFDVNPASVPEPESLALVGLGLCGIAAVRRRSQKQS